MKKIAAFIVVILLICGGALWFLASGSLNDFIKTQIETVGTKITGQTVKVSAVDLKLSQGAGAIKGFSLANPSKYKAAHAFSFEEIGLDINVKSLRSDPIIIDAIIINNPQAFVEFSQDGGANLKDILDTVKRNVPTSQDKETSPEEPASTAKEANISVSKLVLAKTNLTVDLSAFGNKKHQLTLPDINLTNIGGSKGLPASELGAEIGKQALSAIWKQSKKVQKEQVKDKLKDKALKKIGDLFGN